MSSTPQTINLNDTTPAAKSSRTNVEWQADAPSTPTVVRNATACYKNQLALDDDVVVTSPADTQVLTYEASSSKWKNKAASGGGFNGVNAQTGATYTFLNADNAKLVTFSRATAIAAALHRAEPYSSNWFIYVENRGVGTLTITPDAGTIDGAASLVFITGEGALIAFDGTNFFTMSTVPPSGFEQQTNKDAANGYAGLDASALLKAAEVPAFTGDVTKASGSLVTLCTAIQNIPVKTGTPSDAQVLTYVLANSRWEPLNISAIAGANASQLRGISIATGTPPDCDELRYSVHDAAWDYKSSIQNRFGLAISRGGTTYTAIGVNSPAVNGGTAAVVPTATEPYYVAHSTGSGAGASAGVAEGTGSNFSVTRGILLQFEARIQLQQTSAMRVWIGMFDGTSGISTGGALRADNPAQNMIAFRYSTAASDTKYMCYTATDASHFTATAESTSTHVDTNGHVFKITYDGTNVNFYIDNVLVGSQSTNLPAAGQGLHPFFCIDNVGAANNKIMNGCYLMVDTL